MTGETKPGCVLVGTYRSAKGQLAWIEKHRLYNYPLSEDERDVAKGGWNRVRELWLYSGPKAVRYIYSAEFVGIQTRADFLAEHPDYPKGHGHGVAYVVFKISLKYEPTSGIVAVFVRPKDFAGRTRSIAKAIQAYQAGNGLGSLLDNLPDELVSVPQGGLHVCELAVQMDFLNTLEADRSTIHLRRARQLIDLAKMKGKLTCVEICAGAGGQAIGLERAGFEHVALVEYEQAYCDVLRSNKPNWNVICQDVHQFDGRPYAGVDLLAGGVPCPPFSVASKQLGENDERDLFPEAIRLISEIRPRAVMLENVRGLLDPKFDEYRDAILAKIRGLGYVVHIKLLQASDYGVPQIRPRVVIIGIRNDEVGSFVYPLPNKRQAPSVGEALRDLMGANGWRGLNEWVEHANKVAPTIVGGSKKHGGPDLGPTRARRAWAELGVDGLGIANTAPDAYFVGMPKLTKEMIAIIQGFPQDWDFGKKKTLACRMIGNAFPPPVANVVGRSIRKALEHE